MSPQFPDVNQQTTKGQIHGLTGSLKPRTPKREGDAIYHTTSHGHTKVVT